LEKLKLRIDMPFKTIHLAPKAVTVMNNAIPKKAEAARG